MDLNKSFFRFVSFGVFSSWDEIKDGVPRVLLWVFIIIPFFGYVLLGIRPEGNPLEPWIYGLGNPTRRIKDAGLEMMEVQVETNNNMVSGSGFRPGSTDGLTPEEFGLDPQEQR